MGLRQRARARIEAATAVVARAAERVLPPPLLDLLLWPAAAVVAAGGLLAHRRDWCATRALRVASLRLWRERTWLEMVRLLPYWRDRLATDRWRARCRIEGLEHLAPGRPTILAVLHHGPLDLLLSLLRVNGRPAAIMANDWAIRHRPPVRSRLDRREAAAAGSPAATDRLIAVTDLFAVREHLRAGGLLIFAIDGKTGRRTLVTAGGVCALLGRGPLRLAQITGASLHPTTVYSGPGLRCTVRLGPPLPCALVEQRDRHAEAYARLFAALLAGVQQAPGQCRTLLLRTLRDA